MSAGLFDGSEKELLARLVRSLQSHDLAARHALEHFSHRLRSRAQFLFEQHFPHFVEQAVPNSIESPKSRPILSFSWEKLLIRFTAAVLTFAGLLYLLRFEVDNLGA